MCFSISVNARGKDGMTTEEMRKLIERSVERAWLTVNGLMTLHRFCRCVSSDFTLARAVITGILPRQSIPRPFPNRAMFHDRSPRHRPQSDSPPRSDFLNESRCWSDLPIRILATYRSPHIHSTWLFLRAIELSIDDDRVHGGSLTTFEEPRIFHCLTI